VVSSARRQSEVESNDGHGEASRVCFCGGDYETACERSGYDNFILSDGGGVVVALRQWVPHGGGPLCAVQFVSLIYLSARSHVLTSTA